MVAGGAHDNSPITTPTVGGRPGDRRAERGRLRWLILCIFLAAIVYVFVIWMLRPPQTGGLRPGEAAPEIVAPGWLNGEPPSHEKLAGKVIVVDAWFAACPPCAREAPQLVRAYERFQDQGVVFIGLTPDDEDQLADCRRFLKKAGISWPNGYAAVETLEKFLTDGGIFPSAWVIGGDGKVTWNRDSAGTLEEAIADALANRRRSHVGKMD